MLGLRELGASMGIDDMSVQEQREYYTLTKRRVTAREEVAGRLVTGRWYGSDLEGDDRVYVVTFNGSMVKLLVYSVVLGAWYENSEVSAEPLGTRQQVEILRPDTVKLMPHSFLTALALHGANETMRQRLNGRVYSKSEQVDWIVETQEAMDSV